jgi:hypothetical protein
VKNFCGIDVQNHIILYRKPKAVYRGEQITLWAPQGNDIKSLSFALLNYNGHQSVNSGGMGADYFPGNYSIKMDKIFSMMKGSKIKSNRLKSSDIISGTVLIEEENIQF